MRKYLIVVLVLLSVVAMLATSCAEKPPEEAIVEEVPEEGIVKIGFVGPLSGPAAPWGVSAVKGMEMAAEDINEAGGVEIGGVTYKVEIVAVDDRYTAEGAATGIRKLIYEDKVKIVHILAATPFMAIWKTCEENGLVYSTWGATAKALGADKPHSYRPYFSSVERSYFQAPAMKEYFAKIGQPFDSMVFLARNDEAGWQTVLANVEAAKAVGIDVLGNRFYERGVVEFEPYVAPLLALNPDVVSTDVIPMGEQPLVIRSIRELGFKGPIIHCAQVGAATLVEVAGVENAYDVYGTFADYGAVSNVRTEERELYEKWQSKGYGRDMVMGLEGYCLVMIKVQAMQAAGTTEDADKIIKAIETEEFETVKGKCRFTGLATFGVNHQWAGDVFITRVDENGVTDNVDRVFFEMP